MELVILDHSPFKIKIEGDEKENENIEKIIHLFIKVGFCYENGLIKEPIQEDWKLEFPDKEWNKKTNPYIERNRPKKKIQEIRNFLIDAGVKIGEVSYVSCESSLSSHEEFIEYSILPNGKKVSTPVNVWSVRGSYTAKPRDWLWHYIFIMNLLYIKEEYIIVDSTRISYLEKIISYNEKSKTAKIWDGEKYIVHDWNSDDLFFLTRKEYTSRKMRILENKYLLKKVYHKH